MARLLDAEKVDLAVEEVYRLGEIVKSNDAERMRQFISNLGIDKLKALSAMHQYIGVILSQRARP